MSGLELKGLTRRYGVGAGIEDVSLTVSARRYTCVMGGSGAGKTTLLRLLAGLERADRGTIRLDGESLDALPPEKRPVRTLFQSYALFEHLSVFENVAFALRVAGVSDAAVRRQVAGLLESVELSAERHGPLFPGTLSGGQQQRVALARALAGSPRLLLLDEPLSALDRPLRAHLRRLLRGLQEKSGAGFVHVTHDPEEALALADELVVLAGGRVVAHGPPEQLYARPPDLEVARLLGDLSALPAAGPARWIRPERLRLEPCGEGAGSVTVRRIAPLGGRWELAGPGADGREVVLHGSERPRASPGDRLDVFWQNADVLNFSEP